MALFVREPKGTDNVSSAGLGQTRGAHRLGSRSVALQEIFDSDRGPSGEIDDVIGGIEGVGEGVADARTSSGGALSESAIHL